jgi:ubiquinol-cytochrome c reductase cytochrome b subunit
MSLKRKVVDWLEHRTGLESAVKNFLFEDIPASSGWHQVFGSVAVFLFLVLAFTGVLLAFNYAPTPGEAYNSLKYIITELTGGSLIRGLHHWGASLMIVVVVLHMTQVFIWGAYKKPREATWMVGVGLLLITLAFGLTGYLLPWDNRAYWGTVVTTQIASNAPLLGPYLTRLLGSEGAVGAVTFARFFATHVLLLPPITTLLIAIHVYLVRKHGVAPAPEDQGATKKFFPGQVFKDTVAIFIAFAILFVMAVAVKVPLDRLADPTDTAYIPRPDWYFLFLFEILKYCAGPLETLGSTVLPAAAIMTLLLVPFIDRKAVRRWTQRTTAMGVVGMAALGWTALTVAAIVTTPPSKAVSEAVVTEVHDWRQLSPEALAGLLYYRKEQCASCHNLVPGATKVGPDLATASVRRTPAWMIMHFKNSPGLVPGSAMPPVHLEDAQLVSLASFLQNLTMKNVSQIESAPDEMVAGATIYQEHQCGVCHTVNGAGMAVGPPLNGLSRRQAPSWVEVQIRKPGQHKPETLMPGYDLTPGDLSALVAYLMALPE